MALTHVMADADAREDGVDDVAAALTRLARRLEQRAKEIADAIVQEVHAEAWTGVPHSHASYAARAATRANVLALISMLERYGSLATVTTPPQSIDHAEAVAEKGLPLAPLQHAYRLAHRKMWRVCREELDPEASSAQTIAAMGVLADLLIELFDRLEQDVTTAYTERAASRGGVMDAIRADTVKALLAGEVDDVEGASARLRYRLDRAHVGLVLWTSDCDGAGERLRSAASEIATALGRDRPLVVSPVGHVCWLWVRVGDADAGARALEAIRSAGPRPDGVSVAAGSPASGVAGFRRTHEQAVRAQRVARLSERRPGCVVLFHSVAVLSLVASDQALLRQFVVEELGPLSAADDDIMRLRATLWTYLREHRNARQTAARLGIHQNTVSYRLRVCEKLLGRRVTDRRLELELALTALQGLGSGILGEAVEPAS